MTVNQEVIGWFAAHETLNDSRHEIADDDQIAHANTETLDCNCRIKYHGRTGVCQLRQRKE